MIEFNYETEFNVSNEDKVKHWISGCIKRYKFREGELNFIFCDDKYLLKLNQDFLEHDTLTDIISFDYTMGKLIGGDIFISVERVKENAILFNQTFDNELNRVIIHGILHFFGFKDKATEDVVKMRTAEDECLEYFK
ncbi:rRNA maturation RNase YbeY [Lutibacter sp.]|uniref:rRNA maturation RNase YbeY n=1 Tax=Lutibacter sp. TaxID=1925666 RepID=UPI002732E543|nr:rRNA maturation RNase YbeY [Lutibacter sp.]MDP3313897.1 rRNA maturation RNase YbeY [Lutibacter sp.]